ncbi:hypothetical protein ACIRRH_37075 [Kitasatospora sp. NPDC101235]|uniref:hypothetical protein n=1 Tax=Kitasatospora sp. NPDC101235 TaxID=3364101 RepID=UPI0038114127
MDFPSRESLWGLGSAEYQVIAAFEDTVGSLVHELASAEAAGERLTTTTDAAERRLDASDGALPLHFEVLSEVTAEAFAFTSRLARLLWQQAAAYAVVGMTVLDRVVAGQAPLSLAELKPLFTEPALGDLIDLLQADAEQRYAARNDTVRELNREEHAQLVRSLDRVRAGAGRRGLDPDRALGVPLTDLDDDMHDPPWEDILKPIVRLAQQLPYEISAAIQGQRPIRARWTRGEMTSLRNIHRCPGRAATVVEGHLPDTGPARDPGDSLALTVQVCAVHTPPPKAWFAGLVVRPGTKPVLTSDCGLAVDYREPGQALRAHADLWLTPLTGLHLADHDGWPALLAAATAHLRTAYDAETDDHWNTVEMFLGQAAKFSSKGDLLPALAALGHAETATAVALAIEAQRTPGAAADGACDR